MWLKLVQTPNGLRAAPSVKMQYPNCTIGRFRTMLRYVTHNVKGQQGIFFVPVSNYIDALVHKQNPTLTKAERKTVALLQFSQLTAEQIYELPFEGVLSVRMRSKP